MRPVTDLIIELSATIKESMTVIDQGALRIALVVDQNKKFVGTLSDGDIRRGLLRGKTLEDSIADIVKKTPFVVSLNTAKSEMIRQAKEKKISQIPVVNKDNFLVGIYDLNDLLSPPKKDNVVVLMAGGVGARLGELTRNTPKPLLNVGPKPILQTIIENFVKSGFTEILICVNYLSDQIKDYFGDGESLGAKIRYFEERKKMGTAGALALISEHLKKPFFVMNGDILTNVDFEELLEFHLNSKVVSTMAVREYQFQVPYGVVNVNDGIISSIIEKPTETYNVSAGIYVLDPAVIEMIPYDIYFDMPQLFSQLIEKGFKANCYQVNNYWLDVGKISDYEQANADYKKIF